MSCFDKLETHSQKLLFRRQYLLGPKAFQPNKHWVTYNVSDGLILSAHEDLEVCFCSSGSSLVCLIGFLIDPYDKFKSSQEIVDCLHDKSKTSHELIENTTHLSGRWVLIYRDENDFIIFNDPCGLRQVFFAGEKGYTCCGSQPEIVKQVLPLHPDNDQRLLNFIKSKGYGWQEGAWVGAKTVYGDCHHLLPNHYLDMNSWVVRRFSPLAPLLQVDVDRTVHDVAMILQNSLEAVALRSPLMLSVTAGYDSRVLLAASRNIVSEVVCFVDRMGDLDEAHPDVSIPSRIAGDLDFNFNVLNSSERAPAWFSEVNRVNVTRARVLPKTKMIYARYKNASNYLNINGNASEICRNFFDKYATIDQHNLTPHELSKILFGDVTAYAVQELTDWFHELGGVEKYGYSILDLLYWEQRMGNWGAHYPAEQDIAMEEFSPFNNRELITKLLACPASMRIAPDFEFYRMLIELMWPELLDYPFNPKWTETNIFWKKLRGFFHVGPG